jgi:hypothetical protein
VDPCTPVRCLVPVHTLVCEVDGKTTSLVDCRSQNDVSRGRGKVRQKRADAVDLRGDGQDQRRLCGRRPVIAAPFVQAEL